jgi:hypothetical protein
MTITIILKPGLIFMSAPLARRFQSVLFAGDNRSHTDWKVFIPESCLPLVSLDGVNVGFITIYSIARGSQLSR